MPDTPAPFQHKAGARQRTGAPQAQPQALSLSKSLPNFWTPKRVKESSPGLSVRAQPRVFGPTRSHTLDFQDVQIKHNRKPYRILPRYDPNSPLSCKVREGKLSQNSPCTDWLAFFGRTRAQARRNYQNLIHEAFGRPVESPWDQLRGGLALGNDDLQKRVDSLLKEKKDTKNSSGHPARKKETGASQPPEPSPRSNLSVPGRCGSACTWEENAGST